MTRAFILVLDSFGVGGASDAASCADIGATLADHLDLPAAGPGRSVAW